MHFFAGLAAWVLLFMGYLVLAIEPIPAVHWIPLKMKEGKSSLGSTEDSELHWHMARHNMQHLEMVVMMTPAPVRISYRVADKVEMIEMSAPKDMDEKVTADARDHFRNAELNTTTEREKQSTHLLTELVTLPFLIPPMLKETVALQPETPHIRKSTAVEEKPKVVDTPISRVFLGGGGGGASAPP